MLAMPLFDEHIMMGAFIEMGEHFPGAGWDHCSFVIFSGEFDDRSKRIKAHECYEFDLIASVPPEQLDALEPRYVPLEYAGKYFLLKQLLVRICILTGNPAMPDPAYTPIVLIVCSAAWDDR